MTKYRDSRARRGAGVHAWRKSLRSPRRGQCARRIVKFAPVSCTLPTLQIVQSLPQVHQSSLASLYYPAHIARCPQHDIRPYLYHLCCNYPFLRRHGSTGPARLDAKALSGPKPERSHLCCCGRNSACERGNWNVARLASRRAAQRYRVAYQGLFLNRFEDAMTHNPAYRIENPVYLADCVAFVVKSN
jgi:hypothetical protein